MATWGGLSSLFEQPIPKNPSLIESLSPWNQIMPKKPDDATCFTEIFGELHFKEKPTPPAPSANPPAAAEPGSGGKASTLAYLPAKNSDKLQLCTERLGSESSDGVEDLAKEIDDGDHWKKMKKIEEESFPLSDGGSGGEIGGFAARSCSDVRAKTAGFPPPLSSIGGGGKPWIFFKSSREDGRFVLRKVKIPTQEILHASREGGRLTLHLVHSEDDDGEEEDDDEEPPEVEDDEEEKETGNDDSISELEVSTILQAFASN